MHTARSAVPVFQFFGGFAPPVASFAPPINIIMFNTLGKTYIKKWSDECSEPLRKKLSSFSLTFFLFVSFSIAVVSDSALSQKILKIQGGGAPLTAPPPEYAPGGNFHRKCLQIVVFLLCFPRKCKHCVSVFGNDLVV